MVIVRLVVCADMVPVFVKVDKFPIVMVAVVGSVSVPELATVPKFPIPEMVTLASLADDIVPALVRFVMLESVAVGGRGKVAPALLLNVVGLKFKVEPAAKVKAPELVTIDVLPVLEKVTVEFEKLTVPELVKLLVPEVEEMVMGEVEEKLMVLPELLVIPALVMAVERLNS